MEISTMYVFGCALNVPKVRYTLFYLVDLPRI